MALSESQIQALWAGLLWAAPPFFLLQIGALLLLLWRVAWRWQPERLASRRGGRWLLQLGVVLAPLYMLFMSSAMHGGYQGERGGHWFLHSHSGLAGLVLVPIFALGSLCLARALATSTQRTSGTNFIVLNTLLGICVWYAFATYFLGMGDDRALDLSFTAIAPALAAANYVLLGLDIRRHRRLVYADPRLAYAWFAGLGISLLARIPLAQRIYTALPPERPAGYGDCFVVSAATLGHPSFVGSRMDPILGRAVNAQLKTLWAFEARLARRRPSLHRRLRRFYNWLGPRIAGSIRTPLAADIAYVLLKPLEWFARGYLARVRTFRN